MLIHALGNDGIGKSVYLAVAKHNPAHIYIAARDAEKAEAVITEIQISSPNVSVSFIELNLSSFESVRKASEEIVNTTSRLDYTFLNGGVMAINPLLSTDGSNSRSTTSAMPCSSSCFYQPS